MFMQTSKKGRIVSASLEYPGAYILSLICQHFESFINFTAEMLFSSRESDSKPE